MTCEQDNLLRGQRFFRVYFEQMLRDRKFIVGPVFRRTSKPACCTARINGEP